MHLSRRSQRIALIAAILMVPLLSACGNQATSAPSIDDFDRTLYVGESVMLEGRTDVVMPSDYTWWSSNEGVATVELVTAGGVESNALLTGQSVGTAIIYFGSPDDPSPAEATVTVEAPSLMLETLTSWWATTPDTFLDAFSTIRMQFTFENTSGLTLEFVGDEAGSDPASELQLWTVPSVGSPAVAFSVFPEGSYPVGATMSWDVVVDLSTVAAGETGIAIRPVADPSGTLGPSELTLVDATLTVQP